MAVAVDVDQLRLVWLELTSRCQLRCVHCYAGSGPEGDHGTMTADDWRRVIDESAALGAQEVVIIGGEPTLHPELSELVRHALGRGIGVEVYSNLARPLSEELWALFEMPGVRLATSYYSADARIHEGVTLGTPGSHGRTRANIVEALRRSIPIRVGIIEVDDDQDVGAAWAELEALGVRQLKVDRLRQVGRGVRDLAPTVDQLCGGCADGTLAVLPDGQVQPCPMSRWLALGNAHTTTLAEINQQARTTREMLMHEFSRGGADAVVESDARCIPQRGAVVESDARCIPQRGAVIESDARCIPQRGAVIESDARCIPQRGAVVESDARCIPQRGSASGRKR